VKGVQGDLAVSNVWPGSLAVPQSVAADMSLCREISPYAVDSVVRRASALQTTPDANAFAAVELPEASSLSA